MDFLKSKNQLQIEKDAFEKVALEISIGEFKEGLKAKAYSNSLGNKEKAEALYIKYRTQELVEELKESFYKERTIKWQGEHNTTKNNKTDEYIGLTFILLVFLIGVTIYFYDWNKKKNLKSNFELLNPQIEIYSIGNSRFSELTLNGRLVNKSDYSVSKFVGLIRVYSFTDTTGFSLAGSIQFRSPYEKFEDINSGIIGDLIDTYHFEIKENVPPGEVKSFNYTDKYADIDPGKMWVWDYEITKVQ
tara:strand:+ start:11459 stop:12196 length:738 start_codon:yes stop_codon:yes gene_type:complete